MSESEAALRLRVAKLGREIPVALEMLGRGEVNMSTLSMLIPLLKPGQLEILYEARCKTKQQVLEIIARHAPKPDVPDSVRQLPPSRPSARASRKEPPAVLPLALSPTPPSAADASPAPEEFRHRITFTASQRVRDLLSEAQDLLRNRQPDGALEVVFEQALELLVAREKRKKFGQTDKPRTRAVARPPKHSRYVPPDVRRQVHDRDGGQCRFVSPDGQRCSARGTLEFHHQHTPYGRGGVTSVENICLMCQPHNALLAERDYGRALMRRRIARSRLKVDPFPESPPVHDPQGLGGTPRV